MKIEELLKLGPIIPKIQKRKPKLLKKYGLKEICLISWLGFSGILYTFGMMNTIFIVAPMNMAVNFAAYEPSLLAFYVICMTAPIAGTWILFWPQTQTPEKSTRVPHVKSYSI